MIRKEVNRAQVKKLKINFFKISRDRRLASRRNEQPLSPLKTIYNLNSQPLSLFPYNDIFVRFYI